ncbi:MAG: hypothetical protein H6710_10850 [Myxococcales bacterium]|nr:hypothetical protein [Myxococcales bacterium]MCB9702494.1 hypothetical protein [Myxococcales bacterium]
MRQRHAPLPLAMMAISALLLAACGGEPAKPLHEKAEKLEAPPPPKGIDATTFKLGADGNTLGFEMEAPVEKIRGRVPSTAITGEIHVDFMDLTKSTGLVHVDISELELFQRNAKDDGTFGEESKSDLQNEHARNWLEIGGDAPEEERAKNAKIEYSIAKVVSATPSDLSKVEGAERKATLKVEGEFLLHQRKAAKSAEIEVVFTFDGDKPTKLTVKTVKPLAIGLEEYDVHPREAFGKLAAKTLSALSEKVASEAQVSVELSAAPDTSAKPAAPAEPAPAG